MKRDPANRQPRWFPAHRGDAISQRRTTRRAVNELLEGAELAGRDLVTADLARSAADLVDSAREAQDAALWLRASDRLEGLLARLAVGRSGDTGAEVTYGSDRSGGDDPAARLAELLGEPASMGDEA